MQDVIEQRCGSYWAGDNQRQKKRAIINAKGFITISLFQKLYIKLAIWRTRAHTHTKRAVSVWTKHTRSLHIAGSPDNDCSLKDGGRAGPTQILDIHEKMALSTFSRSIDIVLSPRRITTCSTQVQLQVSGVKGKKKSDPGPRWPKNK